MQLTVDKLTLSTTIVRPEQELVVKKSGCALIKLTKSKIGASTDPFRDRSTPDRHCSFCCINCLRCMHGSDIVGTNVYNVGHAKRYFKGLRKADFVCRDERVVCPYEEVAHRVLSPESSKRGAWHF